MTGFTLLELMIAMTIGVFLLGTLAVVLINNSQTRYELEKSLGQMQNARYALQVLSDDVANAGFYGEVKIGDYTIWTPTDKECPTIQDFTNQTAPPIKLPVWIRGLNNISTSLPSCTPDALGGSDIFVVRRSATCAAGEFGCDDFPKVNGLPHIQKSGCGASLTIATIRDDFAGTIPPCSGSPPSDAPIYRLINHVYYLMNLAVSVSGESVPTLMRAELTANGYESFPIAEGIEHLHFEYGVDTSGNGEPNRYRTANDITETDWQNVVSVRVYLIARNLRPTNGYEDERTYKLGRASVEPSGDARSFKRQAYSTTIRLNNIAGPLER
ncbi:MULTISPECIES: PilW family protein [unclassified Thiocapsa]|uniref:PilW family protein n=1 Tax=unclassified Thiocapsa TaxID=2641286 RepID=UPI0035AF3E0D